MRSAGESARETASIGESFYTLAALQSLRDSRPVLSLSPEVSGCMARGADFVASSAGEDRTFYGINTGFGSLCAVRIAPDQLSELQHRHLLSHACGVGEPVSEDVSRMVMLLKLLSFRTGHSGISLDTVGRFIDHWNNDLIPVIPRQGTVGASGDLAPLAHMALPLIGLGSVWHRGGIVEARDVMREKGWEPIRLRPKEGLALTNGVQYINAWAVHSLLRARDLVLAADIVASLSMQGFSTAQSFYRQILHETSYHPERRVVAANLRRLLEGSNHHDLPQCNIAMEDPYSFRCVPQVHGAVRQTLGFAEEVVQRECNSVSDNPLVFAEEGEILTGGNLHGQSTAFALDYMAIAMSELASISERRTYQLLSGQHGLPDFLIADPGLNSGLMIVQYTSAALVNENKVLATPASIDTIPTCHLQEDHVSMGGTSAYKLNRIIDNVEHVLGIELLAAAQAIDLNPGLELSPIARSLHEHFRSEVALLTEDRLMSTEIERSRRFLVESPVMAGVRVLLDREDA
ncbi:MAG TPA: histidine ammonia-lyase [Candidatus Kapabacteria bacterium]|nr:histidine ammonia-lyase [Candidatus Kapabacteria bacterium]